MKNSKPIFSAKSLVSWLLVGVLSLTIWMPSAAADDAKVPGTFIVLIDISGSMNAPFPAPVQADLADSKHRILGVKKRLSRLVKHFAGQHPV